MEHRCAERKPVGVNVLVSSPRMGVVRGTAIDLSAGGMFVETDHMDVRVNAPVTVSFQPDDEMPLVCFQAKGMVVHVCERGFGFMFDDLEPACRRALLNLLADENAKWIGPQSQRTKQAANA